jgi:hypothetical protein
MISAFSGSVRKSRLQCHFGNSFETNGIAASRACGISIRSSPSAVWQVPGTEPVALPRRPLRPTLVPSPAQPSVELVLDRPLDDQPSAKPGELGKHLLRIFCGSSTLPLDSSLSMLACISADGGTVRLTA